MQEVILIVHLMLAVAIVIVVLLQRSEGGALGIGGGGGGFISGRSASSLLTKTTAVLAGLFMTTSLVLTLLAGRTGTPTSVLDQPQAEAPANQDDTPAKPSVPLSQQ